MKVQETKPVIVENHDQVLKRYLSVVTEANEAWFYGYHWSQSDQKRLDEALDFIKFFRNKLKRRAK